MRQKRTDHKIALGWLHSLLLAAFFLLGAAAGSFYAQGVSIDALQEFSAYFLDYLALYRQQERSLTPILPLVTAYIRVPLLAFLTGFTSIGFFVLPLIAGTCGFFISYTVSCLVLSFGEEGLLVGLGLLGPRCLVVIPSFFFLAIPSWQASAAVFQSSFGKGYSLRPVYGHCWWSRLVTVCLALNLGICADLWLSPLLLRHLADIF